MLCLKNKAFFSPRSRRSHVFVPVRFMYVRRTVCTVMAENATTMSSLRRSSYGILGPRAYQNQHQPRRDFQTRAELTDFEKRSRVRISKIDDPNAGKAQNHYKVTDNDDNKDEILSHGKMSEGLANNNNPIVGVDKGYWDTDPETDEKLDHMHGLIQRIVKNPGQFADRELFDNELARLDIKEMELIIFMIRFKKADYAEFMKVQKSLEEYHTSKQITSAPEKTFYLRLWMRDIHDYYKDFV